MLQYFITSKTRRKVITLFSKYPDYRIHIRGLAKITKEDPGNISRELARLEKIGYVKAYKEANTRVYGVNQNFVLFKELQNMVLKTTTKRMWCETKIINTKGEKMKQIQKIINIIRYSEFIAEKTEKTRNTNLYLEKQRRQYVASVPVGFKSRTNSEFFYK